MSCQDQLRDAAIEVLCLDGRCASKSHDAAQYGVCCLLREVRGASWVDGGLSSLETAAGRFMDRPSLRKMNIRAPQVDGVCLSVPEVATDEEGPSPINFV